MEYEEELFDPTNALQIKVEESNCNLNLDLEFLENDGNNGQKWEGFSDHQFQYENIMQELNSTDNMFKNPVDGLNGLNFNLFECYMCKMPFPNDELLQRHLAEHNDRNNQVSNYQTDEQYQNYTTFGCHYCSKSFEFKLDLFNHIRAVHPGESILPPNNNINNNNSELTTLTTQQQHSHSQQTPQLQLQNSSSSSKGFTCIHCKENLDTYSLLLIHTSIYHPLESMPDYQSTAIATATSTAISTSSTNTSTSSYNNYLSSYYCNKCSKNFDSQYYLSLHNEQYHQKRDVSTNQTLPRTTISIERTNRSDMSSQNNSIYYQQQHQQESYGMRVATPDNNSSSSSTNHETEVTNEMALKYKNLLNTTIAKHFDPNSNPSKAEKAIHNRTKNPLNPAINCKQCQRNFSSFHYLHLHMKTHSDDRPFSCLYCDKSFKFKLHLGGHMKKNHQEQYLAEHPIQSLSSVPISSNSDSIVIGGSQMNNGTTYNQHQLYNNSPISTSDIVQNAQQQLQKQDLQEQKEPQFITSFNLSQVESISADGIHMSAKSLSNSTFPQVQQQQQQPSSSSSNNIIQNTAATILTTTSTITSTNNSQNFGIYKNSISQNKNNNNLSTINIKSIQGVDKEKPGKSKSNIKTTNTDKISNIGIMKSSNLLPSLPSNYNNKKIKSINNINSNKNVSSSLPKINSSFEIDPDIIILKETTGKNKSPNKKVPIIIKSSPNNKKLSPSKNEKNSAGNSRKLIKPIVNNINKVVKMQNGIYYKITKELKIVLIRCDSMIKKIDKGIKRKSTESNHSNYSSTSTSKKKILLSTPPPPLPLLLPVQPTKPAKCSSIKKKRLIPPPPPPPTPDKPNKSNNNSNKALNEIRDEFDLFASSIAPKLRRIHHKNPLVAANAQIKIQNLLMEIEFGIK